MPVESALQKKPLIFISHSSKDKLVADAICARLENQGIRCWIAPRDVNPGRDYSDQIEEALERSTVFVTVISSGSNTSRHVKSEIDRAFSIGHIIIPFRVENIELDKGLAYYLSKTHWLDAVTPPLDQHIDRLAATILKLCDQEPSPASAPPPVPTRTASISQKMPATKWPLFLLVGIIGLAAVATLLGVGAFVILRKPKNEKTQVTGTQTQPSPGKAEILPAQTPATNAKDPIEGMWTITEAKTLQGGAYGGTVQFFKQHDRYQVTWQTAAGIYSGVGLLRDHKLCVGWSDRPFGVVFYKISNDGVLNANWALTGAPADQSAGVEKAVGGTPGKIEGEYSIIGSNPGSQNRYGGKLRITRTGDTYQMQWNVNNSVTNGVAIQIDDELFAAFGDKKQAYGVVAYVFKGERAEGVWTLGGASQIAKEDLIKQ
jgi:hypothetical protein